MANNPSAIKRTRQTIKRTEKNTAKLSEMRTHIKKYKNAVETGEGDLQALLTNAVKSIDFAAGHGIIHTNKAKRLKSNLATYAK